MRKIWKLRRIFFPQFIAVLVISISVIAAPHRGACADQKANSVTLTEGTNITTTYETATDNSAVIVTTHSSVVRSERKNRQTAATGEAKPVADMSAIDGSVHAALKKMGLNVKQIELWIGAHPDSTLKNLGSLSAAKQRKVANVATFIRSINRTISPKTAWREASALVYYSMKYGVPTELSVGVAKMESRFNPSAMSRSGACGVMQVMWKVHNGMLRAKGIATKKDHMFDPERGVESGVLILSRYIKAYGTVQKALNRYYGGISTAYLKKVNNGMAMLERHSDNSDF